MLTRRNLLKRWFWASLLGSILNASFLSKFISASWAKTKRLLSKGFPKEQIINMNPADIDSRNLEIDLLDKFETMGPTDVIIDLSTYRLKISGKVKNPLSLSYDQILKYPSLTETILLICTGFFANNGRWTGVDLKLLVRGTQPHKDAKYVDIKGAQNKVVRIPLEALPHRRIFLAFQVNGETLPQKHGFPLRLVYEDAYGSDWVKYVDEIVVL